MKKATLILHVYHGCGYYGISFKRVSYKDKDELILICSKIHDVHFVINGWPLIRYLNGVPVFQKGTNKESKEW